MDCSACQHSSLLYCYDVALQELTHIFPNVHQYHWLTFHHDFVQRDLGLRRSPKQIGTMLSLCQATTNPRTSHTNNILVMFFRLMATCPTVMTIGPSTFTSLQSGPKGEVYHDCLA